MHGETVKLKKKVVPFDRIVNGVTEDNFWCNGVTADTNEERQHW